MRTLLRQTDTGLYFEGTEKWTPSPHTAYDFRFIERARQFVRIWELKNVEVAFDFEETQAVDAASVAQNEALNAA